MLCELSLFMKGFAASTGEAASAFYPDAQVDIFTIPDIAQNQLEFFNVAIINPANNREAQSNSTIFIWTFIGAYSKQRPIRL